VKEGSPIVNRFPDKSRLKIVGPLTLDNEAMENFPRWHVNYAHVVPLLGPSIEVVKLEHVSLEVPLVFLALHEAPVGGS